MSGLLLYAVAAVCFARHTQREDGSSIAEAVTIGLLWLPWMAWLAFRPKTGD